MSSEKLFGTPTLLDPGTRDELVATIARNWAALMGRAPGPIGHDLESMATVFASGAKPATLKQRIYGLPRADPESARLPSDVALPVDGCRVVTPEGRILLDVLQRLQRLGGVQIDTATRIEALDLAVRTRSEWHARWLSKQFDGSLSAPALGAALFLLVNGSIGENQGFFMPSQDPADRALATLVLPILSKFSVALGGREPDISSGIRQHWAFTQVSRLLGRQVARVSRTDGTVMFVRTSEQQDLVRELGRRLARSTTPESLDVAISVFMHEYRAARGGLAVLGLMHEDPTATRRLLDGLHYAGMLR